MSIWMVPYRLACDQNSGDRVRRSASVSRSAPESREKVRLQTSALRDNATLVGAAELAFSDALASPLEVLARMTS